MTTGVLLLHGSSGKPDLDRAQILEAAGYDVVAPQWFDGPISEIPLESFPLDELAARNDRLVVMGMSYGSVAALLLASFDERVDAVVALAPGAHVWAWIGDGEQTSMFTRQGELLLLAGGDDRLWPSVDFAGQLAERRGTRPTQLLISVDAGHRLVFPGEEVKTSGQRMARGGSEEADRAFGQQAWAQVAQVLAGTR
ncbi:acyl-CoA thioester hydrolase/BAAT C-terminal domain-containing protein [Streptomyces sp. SID13031]|uniref:acyl-CoA thioester hydrolase/BAAT C-terminal domain-containing protein n=1 Tax=Streptomyces sp. SID13031 TaxID=2706046 RepID=UPI0013C6E860|nr:alpha/beta hydrolase [Streptomyces sp. SID13031]